MTLSVSFRFRFFFVIGLTLALLRPAPGLAADAEIRGTVLDPDGSAVAGATVTFESAGRLVATKTTDATGRFSTSALTPGRYLLRVLAPGLVIDPQVLMVQTDDHDLTLQTRLSAITESVIVSAATTESLVSSTPASVTVFGAIDVASRQVSSVAELLRTTAGLTVSQSGGFGGLTAVFPRGGESNYSLVLVDGVRVNDMGGGFDFALLPAIEIERIEVVRGAQSAVFGADAIGGVIHVVTRRGGPTRAEGLFEAGSQTTRRFEAGAAGSRGPWSWGAGAGHAASQGFNDEITASGERISNDDGERTSAGGRLHGASPRWRIGAQGRFTEAIKGYPGPFGDDPNGTYSGIDRISRGHNRHYTIAVLADATISPRLRASGTWSYARLTGDFDSPFGASSNDTTRQTGRWLADAAFSSGLSATAGAELLTERGNSSFVTGSSGTAIPIQRRVVGTFLEGRAEWANRLTASAGIRLEHIRRRALEGDFFGTRPAFADSTVVSTNPRVAVSWFLRPPATGVWTWTRVRANAATGIRPPDVFETAFTDNPDLAPERSRSYDAGVEHAFADGKLIVETTWFHNEYDDLIVSVAPDFQDASRYKTDNIANARARGLELLTSVRPVAAITVRAAYTWLDSAILAVDGRSGGVPSPFSVGDPLIRRPHHQGWVDAVATFSRVTAFARLGARGRVLDVDPSFGAFGGRVRGPGYAAVDLGASVNWWKGVSIFGRASNMLDTAYEEALGFSSPGRQVIAGVRLAVGR